MCSKVCTIFRTSSPYTAILDMFLFQDEGWEEEDDDAGEVELSGQTLSSLIDQFAGDYQGE